MIFPVTLGSLKPYKFRSTAIRPAQDYLSSGKETGEVGFDLHYMAKKSKTHIMNNLKEIDRIRKIDVPWIMYIIIFVLLMAGAIVASYFALSILRIEKSSLIPMCFFFIVGLAIAFLFITFLGVQQEEVRDCEKLSHLQNKIKEEQESQLSLQRLNLQLNQMNVGRDKLEQDRCFLAKMNQVRAQSSLLMQGMQVPPSQLKDHLESIQVRLQEAAFDNAKFMCRLYSEMAGPKTMETAFNNVDKLSIIRETFSVNVAICFFAHADRFDSGS